LETQEENELKKVENNYNDKRMINIASEKQLTFSSSIGQISTKTDDW